MRNKFLVISSFLLITIASHAETIQFKSGDTVEGKIVEQTNEFIKVDLGVGVGITYYLDDIESIKKSIVPKVSAGTLFKKKVAQGQQRYFSQEPKESRVDTVPQSQNQPKKRVRKKNPKRGVKITAPTIKDGMEKLNSNSGKVTMPKPYKETVAYKKNVPLAKKAGLNYNSVLNKRYAKSYKNNQFFFLFYNYVEAPRCKKEYVIQKVKVTKVDYNQAGQIKSNDITYLVEVLKLNKFKKTKRADEHIKRYALLNAAKRETFVEAEVGCGQIPGVIVGQNWPYGSKKLYNKLQGYSSDPGFYDKVEFSSSSEYDFGFSFDDKGRSRVDLPYFISK